MKKLFIPSFSKKKVPEGRIGEISQNLPNKIALAYSIQYKAQANEIKLLLEKEREIVSFTQVLGCSKPAFPKSAEAILLISDGRFHATSLALETNLPVLLYDLNNLVKISKRDTSAFERKRKASYVNYLNADKIGVLISNKPGQERIENTFALNKKQGYFFLSNIINTSEFENFPQIQAWVNTACPRMDLDSNKTINMNDLK
jgi:diphthamide biosynthesis enzyme Dph1/Dph2-like protein